MLNLAGQSEQFGLALLDSDDSNGKMTDTYLTDGHRPITGGLP